MELSWQRNLLGHLDGALRALEVTLDSGVPERLVPHRARALRMADNRSTGGTFSVIWMRTSASHLATIARVDIIRLLLVDDHRMLTEALAVQLSITPDLWVVGQCTIEDPALVAVAARLRPDVITIEVEPVRDPAALLGRLRTASPDAHLVVLTASRDPAAAVDAARAGADAWVSKESSVTALVEALRGACRGHAFYPPEQLGIVLHELREDVRRAQARDGPLDVLTARERDVLTHLVEGRRAAEIADKLGLSGHTVRTHTSSIFAKLGVHTRLEAVSVARAAGMGLRAGRVRIISGAVLHRP